MAAFNVVRFRVKPGTDRVFLDAHRNGKAEWPGLLRGFIVKTGDQSYCLIGEWSDMKAIEDARARMIGTLDTFRHTLDDLGSGTGITDAVSGPVVLALK